MRLLTLALAAFTLLACASQPSVQEGPDAQVTFDGLVRMNNSRLQYAWVDPDVDFSRYTQFLPGGAEFEFREVEALAGTTARSATRREFPISDANRQRLKEVVGETFREELSRSRHFTQATERGPDVLIVEGALLDVVSTVPPQQAGRGNIYLSRVGEATLVIQLRDSMTNTVIARGIERRAAGQTTGMVRNNAASSWAEVRRLARRWAAVLREALDSFHG